MNACVEERAREILFDIETNHEEDQWSQNELDALQIIYEGSRDPDQYDLILAGIDDLRLRGIHDFDVIEKDIESAKFYREREDYWNHLEWEAEKEYQAAIWDADRMIEGVR